MYANKFYTYTQLNEPNELLYDQLSKGCIDAEPDEFYFNVNGYSGKFAFDWSVANNIVVSSEHPVTVKYFQEIPNSKTITKWQLQTPEGDLYTGENYFSYWSGFIGKKYSYHITIVQVNL